MDLSKIRKKLQEAKTVEEKRLIVEELRDRRSRLWELYRTILSVVLLLLSGQGVAGIYVVYSRAIGIVSPILLAVLQGLAIPVLICVVVLYQIDKKIREIDNILLDPETMLGRWIIITILITSLTLTIIGTIFGLASLGIIHL